MDNNLENKAMENAEMESMNPVENMENAEIMAEAQAEYSDGLSEACAEAETVCENSEAENAETENTETVCEAEEITEETATATATDDITGEYDDEDEDDEDDEEIDMDAPPSPKSLLRKRILLIAAIISCLAIIATGTLAFFTAEETAYNVITTGTLDMDLIEETTGGEPWPDNGISGVMPGMEIDKIPYAVNKGGLGFYTRMWVQVDVYGEGNKPLSAKYVSLNIDKEHWTEHDGYYYYNGVVKPGEETEPLFTKVTISKDMPNAYMNSRIEILVEAQAVQSDNNGDSAIKAGGWDEAERMEGEGR